jgi:hypothetical protein
MRPERALSVGCVSGDIPVRLDRGDWMVDRRSKVWKVLENRPSLPPKHIGFLQQTKYKQQRGGGTYVLYDVTTLNRREKIGRIDQMGRAFRFVPRRNLGFAEVDEGSASLPDSVGAIFQSKQGINLVPTTERRLAFELLDKDGDGLLRDQEIAGMGDRIPAADTNGDDAVDFDEFSTIDQL